MSSSSSSPIATATRVVVAPAIAQKLTAICSRCGLRGHLTADCQANLPRSNDSAPTGTSNSLLQVPATPSRGNKRPAERRTVLLGFTPISRGPGVQEFIPVVTIDGEAPTPYTIIHNEPDSFYDPQPSASVSTMRRRTKESPLPSWEASAEPQDSAVGKKGDDGEDGPSIGGVGAAKVGSRVRKGRGGSPAKGTCCLALAWVIVGSLIGGCAVFLLVLKFSAAEKYIMTISGVI
ncbi:hypothetical protein BKA70DRAFT_1223680 [Coprinopsis sp. MPI-PUGE-AT-0042]|nr:hypothetical protein BKA70DRAFT_1223680 [Coprinopsis sp. MPI-PUGE-AT-0042]